jgi:hypothetical protein
MKGHNMNISKKRRGDELKMKTIQGKNGTYLFFLGKDGDYHVFAEVEAKNAARDCGAKVEANTRTMCKEVWDRN